LAVDQINIRLYSTWHEFCIISNCKDRIYREADKVLGSVDRILGSLPVEGNEDALPRHSEFREGILPGIPLEIQLFWKYAGTFKGFIRITKSI
jgi:hypothetical protein